MSAEGELGGRRVDANGVNDGMLRCPRCASRLLSQKGALVQRSGDDRSLWIPRDAAAAASSGGDEAAAAAVQPAEPYEWTEAEHEWWWLVEDVNDLDNVALSLTLLSPRGECRLALCTDCRCSSIVAQ